MSRSFIDAVEQRTNDIMGGDMYARAASAAVRQAMAEVLAAAGPVGYAHPVLLEWLSQGIDATAVSIHPEPSVEFGLVLPLFTAPPADVDTVEMNHAHEYLNELGVISIDPECDIALSLCGRIDAYREMLLQGVKEQLQQMEPKP